MKILNSTYLKIEYLSISNKYLIILIDLYLKIISENSFLIIAAKKLNNIDYLL